MLCSTRLDELRLHYTCVQGKGGQTSSRFPLRTWYSVLCATSSKFKPLDAFLAFSRRKGAYAVGTCAGIECSQQGDSLVFRARGDAAEPDMGTCANAEDNNQHTR